MSRKILGLDINNDSVTAVLVLNAISGNQIAAACHIARDGNTAHEGFRVFVDRALAEIKTRMDVAGCTCVAAYPADQVSFRNVTIPFKNSRKIKQVLPFELEPTLPVPVEEMDISFQHVKFRDEGKLLVAVIPKTYTEERNEVLSAHGLTPEMVTISGYAVAMNLIQTQKNGIFLDVMDDYRVSVGLFADGQLCVYRNIALAVSSANAANRIALAVTRTLASFSDIFQESFSPEAVYITGKGLAQTDLKTVFEDRFNLPVHEIDMRAQLNIHLLPEVSYRPEIMDRALCLTMLDIMGMEGLNFRERPFAGKKLFSEYKNRFVRTGVLAGVVLVIAMVSLFSDMAMTTRKIDAMDRQIKEIYTSTFPETTRIVDAVHQMRTAVAELKQANTASADQNKKVLAVDLLNQISKKIPKSVDVEVIQLVIGPDGVQLSGDTDSFNSVDEMKNSLESVSMFGNVKINSATIDKATKRIRFKLKMTL